MNAMNGNKIWAQHSGILKPANGGSVKIRKEAVNFAFGLSDMTSDLDLMVVGKFSCLMV